MKIHCHKGYCLATTFILTAVFLAAGLKYLFLGILIPFRISIFVLALPMLRLFHCMLVPYFYSLVFKKAGLIRWLLGSQLTHPKLIIQVSKATYFLTLTISAEIF